MKKWNIILPLFAFLFAVVAAFATNITIGGTDPIQYRDISGTCHDCEAMVDDPNDCEVTNKGPACECEVGPIREDAAIKVGLNCTVLNRPEIP